MDGVRTCRGARALGILLLLVGSFGIAAAQDRREALEALERERTQAWRDAQAHGLPQWTGATAFTWLPPVAGESPCFSVQRFELSSDPSSGTSADLDAFSDLLDDLGAFAGACLGPQSLEVLRRNLNARLVSQGYATSSVSFPPQNLALGVLRVHLLPGRVARVELRGAAGAIGRNALALQRGDVLNLRAIEQTLENLARLPSQTAQFQIEAAEQPGESVVAIAVEPARTWRGGVGLDNAAPRDYGRFQATAQAAWDSPLGLSDQVTVYVSGTTHSEGGDRFQRSTQLSYSVPSGRHLLSANATRSLHARAIQGLTTTFSENGIDTSAQWRWQYTAWRNTWARWQVWGGGTERRSRNAVDDVELVLQRRHTRSADWGINAWLRLTAGELTLDAEVAVPRRVGADTDVQLDPPALARMQRVQASWQQPIQLGGRSLHYESRLLWAGVRHPASAADLQTLGSRWSVRGFDGQRFLTGQEQVTWRQDLRLDAFTVAGLPGLQLQPRLALDCGRVGAVAPEALPFGRVLAGAAAGLRWGRQGWHGDLTVAAPLRKPAGFPSSPVVIDASLNFNY